MDCVQGGPNGEGCDTHKRDWDVCLQEKLDAAILQKNQLSNQYCDLADTCVAVMKDLGHLEGFEPSSLSPKQMEDCLRRVTKERDDALLEVREKDEWIKALETRINTQTQMLAKAGLVKLTDNPVGHGECGCRHSRDPKFGHHPQCPAFVDNSKPAKPDGWHCPSCNRITDRAGQPCPDCVETPKDELGPNLCGEWTQWGQCIASKPCPAHSVKRESHNG
jgi:hypothetical protein